MSCIHRWLSKSGSSNKRVEVVVALLLFGVVPEGQDIKDAFTQSRACRHDPLAPLGGNLDREYDEHKASPGHHRHDDDVQASQLVNEYARQGSQS
jgi:hypothetical protein